MVLVARHFNGCSHPVSSLWFQASERIELPRGEDIERKICLFWINTLDTLQPMGLNEDFDMSGKVCCNSDTLFSNLSYLMCIWGFMFYDDPWLIPHCSPVFYTCSILVLRCWTLSKPHLLWEEIIWFYLRVLSGCICCFVSTHCAPLPFNPLVNLSVLHLALWSCSSQEAEPLPPGCEHMFCIQ